MGVKWVLFCFVVACAWYLLRIDHIFGQWGLGLIIVIIGFIWTKRAADISLNRWAQRSNYQIISREPRALRTGPFFLRTGKGQHVYHVTVSDSRGKIRSGWVRVGDWWVGLTSDKADVRWDDEGQ